MAALGGHVPVLALGGLVPVLALGGFVAAGVGATMVYYGLQGYRQRTATLDRVDPVEATVVETGIESQHGGQQAHDPDRRYRPIIRFEYEYGGQTHESGLYSHGVRHPLGRESRAERTLAEYPEGETVTVFVDPENPSEGFLERGSSAQNLGLALLVSMGAIFGFLGVGGLVFVAILSL